MSGYRGRGGGWGQRGRGGYHTTQVFQAKKWVKPGSSEAVPATAGPEPPPAIEPDQPAAGGGARKWVKGQGFSGPAPPPPPPERGRLSVFVGNLDPNVQEDNLWRFFGQAGRISSVKMMPKKDGKPFCIAFVNFADGTLLGKCRDMLKALDDTAPSWNKGVKISVAERDAEGGKNKPMKARETEEQRHERLAKLREQWPWLPHEHPAELVRRWGQREGKQGHQISQQKQVCTRTCARALPRHGPATGPMQSRWPVLQRAWLPRLLCPLLAWPVGARRACVGLPGIRWDATRRSGKSLEGEVPVLFDRDWPEHSLGCDAALGGKSHALALAPRADGAAWIRRCRRPGGQRRVG